MTILCLDQLTNTLNNVSVVWFDKSIQTLKLSDKNYWKNSAKLKL